ncbi:putative toxin [Streptomyces sp. NPDC058001]|uniref:putative toxin n=1 Tax=Streptomyces sp. NPDC058001 TaxID=3346300 RepID=UPI0036E353BE
METGSGTRVQVAALTRWTQQATVYNLTVAELHTYYVLAGLTPVLVHNAGGGGRNSCVVGQQGEAASGIVKNTQRITINGRGRTPDELDHMRGVIGEVKNVKYQYLSTQIKDYLDYAQANGYGMNLYVRGNTRLSGPLQARVDSGDINLIRNLP